MSNSLPCRKTLQLSVQHVGQETLIYDEQTHKAFCLNAMAAAVWNRCDGATTVPAIAASAAFALDLPMTEDLVQFTLQELLRDGLLDAAVDFVPVSVVSRRQMMVKLGIGAAMAMPIIATIVAPKAAQAYNGCVDC